MIGRRRLATTRGERGCDNGKGPVAFRLGSSGPLRRPWSSTNLSRVLVLAGVMAAASVPLLPGLPSSAQGQVSGASASPDATVSVGGSAAPAAASTLPTASTSPCPPTPSAAPSGSPLPSAAVSPPPDLASSALPTAEPCASGPEVIRSRFGGGLLIADRGNGRIIAVDEAGGILWSFPGPAGLPRGQGGFAADDAFLSPDGKTIVANEEDHHVIVRIDVATRTIIWEYGRWDHPGSGRGRLNTPDDAYPLANGDITVADIKNCRILQISPQKRIVHQWGQTGVCTNGAPNSYSSPNGDTPLPDGGMLITQIGGSRVVRLSPSGKVLFDIHVPASYPSDAQLDPAGHVVIVDYTKPGSLLVLDQNGRLIYRYRPRHGPGKLSFPSLALPLPDGTYVLNDDDRNRVIVIDPATNRIVWQYGHTGQAGSGPGYLSDPDGIDPVPVGTFR